MTARFFSVVVVMLILVATMFYVSQKQWDLGKQTRITERRFQPVGYFDDEHSEIEVASNEG